MKPVALLASLATAGYTALYVMVCAVWPFGRCRRCAGTGRLHSPITRRLFRLCPRCEGTGRRIRIGRRIYEHLRSQYRDGTR